MARMNAEEYDGRRINVEAWVNSIGVACNYHRAAREGEEVTEREGDLQISQNLRF